jgi:hypothetical protein
LWRCDVVSAGQLGDWPPQQRPRAFHAPRAQGAAAICRPLLHTPSCFTIHCESPLKLLPHSPPPPLPPHHPRNFHQTSSLTDVDDEFKTLMMGQVCVRLSALLRKLVAAPTLKPVLECAHSVCYSLATYSCSKSLACFPPCVTSLAPSAPASPRSAMNMLLLDILSRGTIGKCQQRRQCADGAPHGRMSRCGESVAPGQESPGSGQGATDGFNAQQRPRNAANQQRLADEESTGETSG